LFKKNYRSRLFQNKIRKSVLRLAFIQQLKNRCKFFAGPLSQYTIQFLKSLREFFGLTFKLENAKSEDMDEDVDAEDVISGKTNNYDHMTFRSKVLTFFSVIGSNKVMMTCVGIGYSNISRRVV
jgi:RNA 3'-terminal phosphate cyclase-like protein